MPSIVRLLLVVCLLGMILPQLGCSCREETPAELAARQVREADAEKKRLEEERAKADLILMPTSTLPSSPKMPALYLKPGHWNSVALPIKANQINFDGTVSQMLTDPKGQPIPIDRTRYRLTTSRPMVIAEQSTKQAESLVYCPPTFGPKRLDAKVYERKGGSIKAAIPQQPTRQLLDHQYHFIVLAKEPTRYAFLESLHSVTQVLPSNLDSSAVTKNSNSLPITKNYRVVAIPAVPTEVGLPLPDNPIAWTSIAYLLWDEVDPALLRPEQRDAIVDWINWGGQLLVSGPDSLDLLRGSFLDSLLPAESSGARRIESSELATMNATWNVSRNAREVIPKEEWTGVGLKPLAGGTFMPGLDGLLAERRVGRGRIVVSGFQLAQPQLLAWAPGVDNLYNAALLRRPPRRFARDAFGGQAYVTLWAEGKTLSIDPMKNSNVRLLMRDTHADEAALSFVATDDDFKKAESGSSYLTMKEPKVRGGAGGWNDFHLASEAVRSTLRESAGVKIPGVGFVAFCLLVYLVLLVPINGFFFHALGKVELAWVAAPILAIVAALVVVRQAQLDIGFVRSQTEIAVLEVQPDSPRGVLTRFTALYASLTTPYDLEFERGTAVAVPFPGLNKKDKFERKENYQTEVTFTRQEKSRLRGLVVSSASTEFVRSEEIVNIEEEVPDGSTRIGAVQMGKSLQGEPRLENQTKWNLESVMIVRRQDGIRGPAMLEGCWIGELPAGSSALVAMTPLYVGSDDTPFKQERADEAVVLQRPDDMPKVESLMKLALDGNRFEPGERRVIARISQPIEGLTVSPPASQRRGSTLYVGHLNYGLLPPPRSDKNTPTNL